MIDSKIEKIWRQALILLGLGDHALSLLLGETTLVVGDGYAVRLAGDLVGGRDVEDTVGINIEVTSI